MKISRQFMVLCSTIAMTGNVLAAGPVTIDDAWVTQHGSTVTGTFTGTASQAALSVSTKKPVLILNTTVTGPGNLIHLASGTNVSVINTHGTGTNPNVYGTFKGSFVTASSPASLVVRNCTVAGVYFGVYAAGFAGDPSSAQTISVTKNVFNNIDGRASDGKGGYIMSGYAKQPHPHAIQLNGIRGVSNIEIAWNQSIVTPFQGLVNDTINIYSSSGTKSSHLKVHDNFVKGAMGPSPGNGENYSGGGIITDGKSTDTSTTATAYVDIYNNQVVMTANYGVAVAAGHDNAIFNNRVVSAGKLPNGTLYAMTYANGANNGNLQHQPSSTFYNNHVHDNLLGLIRKGSNGSPSRSDWWFPGQSTTENNQHFIPNTSGSPTIADEANEFSSWQKKLVAKGIMIGAQ